MCSSDLSINTKAMQFSDIDVDKRQVASFYKQLYSNINKNNISDDFKNKWEISFTNNTDLIDNADVGGYSKAIFSHFIKYCLFYDEQLLNTKKQELNNILNMLKGDYKKLCENKNSILSTSIPSNLSFDYIKSDNIQNQLNNAKCELLDERKEYNDLPTSIKERYPENLYKNPGIQKRANGEIWWDTIKQSIIEEYRNIKCTQKDYEFRENQIKLIPFIVRYSEYDNTRRYYFIINNKLDINSIYTNSVNLSQSQSRKKGYYSFVGLMLGKYITQELPLWQSPGQVQYAKDHIPMGKVFGLLILNGYENITKKAIYDAINYDHSINLEEQLNNIYNDDNINFPVNDSDIVSVETINKIIKYFVCHDNDELKTYFDSFLAGISVMVKKQQGINPQKLLNFFKCDINEDKIKFLDILNKNKNNISSELKNNFNLFINIINEMNASELPKLYEFISGSTCCPDNIVIQYNSYKVLFTSHTCSNGLDFPKLDINTKDKLKEALEISLKGY